MIKKDTKEAAKDFPLSRINYILIIIGMVIVAIGYLLMSGGGIDDPNQFSRDIFSTRRITVGPLVSTAGFLFIIYAIMKKPKDE